VQAELLGELDAFMEDFVYFRTFYAVNSEAGMGRRMVYGRLRRAILTAVRSACQRGRSLVITKFEGSISAIRFI
jgi:hypothetical protein